MRKSHPNDKMCEGTNAHTFTESDKPFEECCFLITVFYSYFIPFPAAHGPGPCPVADDY